MFNPEDILQQYWGFNAFRPLQRDIVQSVLDGHDTLALLPTGGGKSLCFQVPALCIDQLCLVVSPLIALMNDQVDNLRKRGIEAGLISSAMAPEEIPVVLDNCMRGKYKFLYVSPERLSNEHFIEALRHSRVGMIAVDEAHCISQWGYDFRPAYLEISKIRALIGLHIPVIALTATATPEVCDDIEKRLEFRNHKRFQKSFRRPELVYVVRETEDKLRQILRILDKVPGSSVIYVRNRKKTREISDWLIQQGIAATSYHAGIDFVTRALRQQHWIEGKIRVIVCTNAFGMGIDKPDVRSVIHIDLPDSPEAYFQEAGRAGRDGQKSWGILLAEPADAEDALLRFKRQFPGFDTVKAIYNWIGNYLQLPVGSGEGLSYPFDAGEFSNRYKIHPIECVNAIRFMEQEGLLSFSGDAATQSRVYIPVDKETLYEYEVKHQMAELLLRTMLRSYGGMFQDYVVIRERELAERCGLNDQEVKKRLQVMHQAGVISYFPANQQPKIFFTIARQHPDRLPMSAKTYAERAESATSRFKAMVDYMVQTEICRSAFLLNYFGEKNPDPCGKCDVCLKNKSENIEKLQQQILAFLHPDKRSMDELEKKYRGNTDLLIEAIRGLLDKDLIVEASQGVFKLKS
jgi:ATP-dependent DNA helicase RecQ